MPPVIRTGTGRPMGWNPPIMSARRMGEMYVRQPGVFGQQGEMETVAVSHQREEELQQAVIEPTESSDFSRQPRSTALGGEVRACKSRCVA